MSGLFDDLKESVLEGVVDRVVYRPLEGEFAVLRIRKDDGRQVTATGTLGGATVGERLRLTGRFEDHQTYGRQFRVERMERRRPTSEEGLIAFLTGPRFKGVGPVLAKRIVETLGSSVLEDGKDPKALAKVPGVSDKKAREISQRIRAVDDEDQAELWLLSAGVRGAMVQRARKALGEDAVEKIRKNPYLLAEEVEGVGFKRADAVAGRLGILPDAPERIRAAVLHAMREAEGEGHTFQTREDLSTRLEALGVPAPEEELLRTFSSGGLLARDGGRFYLVPLLGAESRGARQVAARLRQKDLRGAQLPPDLDSLSSAQKDAVAMALTRPLALLTGGPGTGKTTAIRGVVEAARREGLRLALSAPSGRAARRLVEATGHEAQTLHRLLRLRPGSFSPQPVDADLVVVDESSMLDILLFESLLSAVPEKCGLLLVGDADQLPPIGAGSPFLDLVASGQVPTIRLTAVYRQSETSRLHENAHLIRDGQFPKDGGTDFIWHRVQAPQDAARLAVELAREESLNFGSDEVEVLTAGNRSETGAEELNTQLQASLNSRGTAFRLGKIPLRVGDKVLQRKNDYQKGVYNGEIGRVESARDGFMEVRFPAPEGDVLVPYDDKDAGEVSLGYALTVHKAQGSEFPVVICVLSTQHYPLLRRNLLYTAVTRAKTRLHLVASPRAVGVALRNQKDQERRSAFLERLAAAR